MASEAEFVVAQVLPEVFPEFQIVGLMVGACLSS